MTNINKKEPVIRFDGFTDAWEQRKLLDNTADVLDYRGKSPNKFGMTWGETGYLVLSALNVKDGYIDKNIEAKYGDEDLFHLWMGSRRLEKGDVIFTTEAPLGNVAQVPDNEGYILNQRAVAFKINKNRSDNNFFAQLLKSPLVQSKLIANASGGTAKGLGMKEFAKLSSFIPKNVDESILIGNFFKQLDETITLQERELVLLKEQKESLLQKMFPKKGSKVPEMRFAEFTDGWEHRKLGEMFYERSDRSAEGELISVTINSGVLKASDLDRKDNSSNDKSNYKQVKMGDIAYNSMRMWQGASGYSPYNGILSPAYTVIVPKEGIDSKFFAYNFKRYEMIQVFKRNSQGLTSDTWNLKFPTLKSIKLTVPCGEEQKQISNFFQKLDDTITLQERKLETLKNMKKSFLQKMFV